MAASVPSVTADFYPRPPGGGRQLAGTSLPSETGISIHALRVEGDGQRRGKTWRAFAFLSTPSGWRATCFLGCHQPFRVISIHALRVEGDRVVTLVNIESIEISIHALRVEGDPLAFCRLYPLAISIHALRVEGDFDYIYILAQVTHFYPRPPGGGRLQAATAETRISPFLSTPSGWRATFRRSLTK